MTTPDRDEFFIGYLPAMPRDHGRFTRAAAAVFALIGITVAILSTSLRRDPGPGVWNSDQPRDFIGIIDAEPYPILHGVTAEGLDGPGPASAILVGTGKHAPAIDTARWAGRPVRIRGTSLRRDDLFLIEIADGPDAIAESATVVIPDIERVSPALATLRGEIIDPKCYAGAMKPGDGKAHRACAVRCISGGIPPVLAVPRANGGADYYLLAGPDGSRLNQAILPYIGDTVEVSGMAARAGRARMLRIDPAAIRRL
ncbi:MAG: hypothetical protein IT436_12815 [Phycisphaerales bacterium]|nr:hypothetical protein [Phycisphaerales bacterium]